MISKELLNEVLGIKLRSNINIRGNTLTHSHSEYGWVREINIYELAHKCKEWAFNKGYRIESYFRKDRNDNIESWADLSEAKDSYINDIHLEDFVSDTEPEAIFKACQYILEKGGK